MNPLDALRQLVAEKSAAKSTAVVSRVEGQTLFLVDKGQSRAATMLPGDISRYKPGDSVVVEGGVVVGKDTARRTKYVYI